MPQTLLMLSKQGVYKVYGFRVVKSHLLSRIVHIGHKNLNPAAKQETCRRTRVTLPETNMDTYKRPYKDQSPFKGRLHGFSS